jgi:xanthine dehydrogenase YagR molybdenum-binding subunit
MSEVVGRPVSRLDGRAKVTGGARYVADTSVADILHAVLVPSTVPSGTIASIDLAAAESSPGVIRIFTHRNTPKFASLANPPAGETLLPLQDEHIVYEGQAVALVVADSLERATEAAKRVRLTYRERPFGTNFLDLSDRAEARPLFGNPPDTSVGDFASALSNGDVSHEGVYLTADRHHNPMEPSATLAIWRDGELLIHDAVQGVVDARDVIARALQLDRSRVRVKNEFVGGAFGCKGWVWPHQILAAMAARELRRSIKLVLTRAQSYTSHGYQPASRQTVTLAARADGTLTGIRHDSVLAGSLAGEHVEPSGWGTLALYASPAIAVTHRVVRLNRGNPTPMRAPLEGVGLVAVEIAMDELAYKLGMDPLELRLRNYAEVDPQHGRPFSSKRLRACYDQGASQFGWSERSATPRSMRDGRDLVGYGMATALFAAFRRAAKARVSIDRAGDVLIESSTQEIGTGTRTVIAQVAADVLDMPVERVSLLLGDTTLPEAGSNTGSTATLSVGSAAQDAAMKLKRMLNEAGGEMPADYPAALARLGVERLSADGEWVPASPGASWDPSFAMYSFGAIFAEVRVDEDMPIPRVSRVIGVYNAGRIINPKTARSQMTGGIVWGIGQALTERSDMDHRLGRFLSKNLAGYLVPVNADVPEVEVSFIDDFDEHIGPLGSRGIGELGAIGVGPAIANAVFHATGTRVREVPIRAEHLLSAA